MKTALSLVGALCLASVTKAGDSNELTNAQMIMNCRAPQKINHTDFKTSVYKTKSNPVLRVEAVGESVREGLEVKGFSKSGNPVSLEFIMWMEGSPGAQCIYYRIVPTTNDPLSQVTVRWKKESKKFDLESVGKD